MVPVVGKVIFVGWSDSDASLTGGENTLPNFKGRMFDVQNNLATAVINFTENDIKNYLNEVRV